MCMGLRLRTPVEQGNFDEFGAVQSPTGRIVLVQGHQ